MSEGVILRTIRFVIIGASCFLFTSCSELSPSCDAAQAKREIRQLISEKLPSHVELTMVGVTTLRTNYATGEVLCSAKVEVHDAYTNTELSRTVGYMVQYDKKHQLKVTVF
ncbi:hypothetical protein CWI76_01560 [Pseudidiomarina marina]|uniref:Uncharacterized protein n=1 Tax=Pseudidiomarina marina TaxID=502366 RepID=A0A432YJ70_9GAMM|nr:hypothetical protein CWI76_01560 [Pseudidiomarina marina]